MNRAAAHDHQDEPDAGADGRPERRRCRADREHDLFATIVEDAFSEILVFDAETPGVILANQSANNSPAPNAAHDPGIMDQGRIRNGARA